MQKIDIKINPSSLSRAMNCNQSLVFYTEERKLLNSFSTFNKKAVIGTIIHIGLEYIIKMYMSITKETGRLNMPQEKELLSTLFTKYNETSKDKIDITEFTEIEQKFIFCSVREAFSLLKQAINRLNFTYVKDNDILLFPEHTFTMDMTEFNREKVNFSLKGQADLIAIQKGTKNAWYKLYIVDYKTGETFIDFSNVYHQLMLTAFALFNKPGKSKLTEILNQIIESKSKLGIVFMIIKPNALDGKQLDKVVFSYDELRTKLGEFSIEFKQMLLNLIKYYESPTEKPNLYSYGSHCKSCNAIFLCKEVDRQKNKILKNIENSDLISKDDMYKNVESLYKNKKVFENYFKKAYSILEEKISNRDTDEYKFINMRRLDKWLPDVHDQVLQKVLSVGLQPQDVYSSLNLPLIAPNKMKELVGKELFESNFIDLVNINEVRSIRENKKP